ncbi:polyprenyl synthetase family protein [Candidatus Woesearchaeota archaeon]|nr:MAG: polyprenyl synthetase family protein [Candidatus Woesearchaeota archaeon]
MKFMQEIIGHYAQILREETDMFLKNMQREALTAGTFTQEVYELLKDYVSRGKFLRGSLLLFAQECYAPKYDVQAVQAAIALELIHAALLIQDDIMDRSVLRRGCLALHKSFESRGEVEQFQEVKKTGESLALCAADALIFVALRLIKHGELMDLFSKELHRTALGQMADIMGSASRKTFSKDKILKIYQYKTARYTFSLPLAAGVILAGRNPAQLEKIGEEMGLLYNLRDDYLDFTSTSGKDQGSDFKENKQTMYRLLLCEKTSEEPKDFEHYKELLEKHGVFKEVDQLMLTYHENILKQIAQLDILKKEELALLATNLLTRKK